MQSLSGTALLEKGQWEEDQTRGPVQAVVLNGEAESEWFDRQPYRPGHYNRWKCEVTRPPQVRVTGAALVRGPEIIRRQTYRMPQWVQYGDHITVAWDPEGQKKLRADLRAGIFDRPEFR